MTRPSDQQLDAEIADHLATKAKVKKPRTRKAKGAPETDRERLERELLDEDARLRSAHKGGATPAQISEQRSKQAQARAKLANRIAIDLGHSPLKQGMSYECFRCGKSGTFDVGPFGAIFTEKCG